MAQKAVPNMKDWADLISQLLTQIGLGLITRWQMNQVLKHRNPFAFSTAVEDWVDFYREVFGLDTCGVSMPTKRDDSFDMLVVVPKWMDIERLLRALPKFLDFIPDASVNLADTFDQRSPQKNDTYAVWLLRSSGCGITLLERLLVEMFYCWQTGQEDAGIRGYTACTGSSIADGKKPCLFWADPPGGKCLMMSLVL